MASADRPDDTEALARAARDGAAAGLGPLYTKILPALYAWARLRIRPEFRRVCSAEDLVQEVWLRAAQAFASFDPARVSFRPWLFAVAKNVLYETQRRALRQTREASPQGDSAKEWALDQVPADVTSLTERVRRDESVRIFLERVALLDEDDRRVLTFCGLEELSLREAAERLDATRDAVAKRWQRLRERMRSWDLPDGFLADSS